MTSQLKGLGQIAQVKSALLRQVIENDLVPGLPSTSSGFAVGEEEEYNEVELAQLALAAILVGHGFERDVVRTIVKKAVSQLAGGRQTVSIDFRGTYPVQVKVTVGKLMTRIKEANLCPPMQP